MEEIKEWKRWPKNPNYLVSSDGQVKGKTGKILTQSIKEERGGYLYINVDKPEPEKGRTSISVHRILMETFYPIENMDELLVDHIDGNRLNNNLNNLRWVTSQKNTQLKNENRKLINTELQRLIQNYGYQKTLELLKNL